MCVCARACVCACVSVCVCVCACVYVCAFDFGGSVSERLTTYNTRMPALNYDHACLFVFVFVCFCVCVCWSDVNECETNNGGCVRLRACINTVGGRFCAGCQLGYEIHGVTGCKGLYEVRGPNLSFVLLECFYVRHMSTL